MLSPTQATCVGTRGAADENAGTNTALTKPSAPHPTRNQRSFRPDILTEIVAEQTKSVRENLERGLTAKPPRRGRRRLGFRTERPAVSGNIRGCTLSRHNDSAGLVSRTPQI